jgi:hypothetical protein
MGMRRRPCAPRIPRSLSVSQAASASSTATHTAIRTVASTHPARRPPPGASVPCSVHWLCCRHQTATKLQTHIARCGCSAGTLLRHGRRRSARVHAFSTHPLGSRAAGLAATLPRGPSGTAPLGQTWMDGPGPAQSEVLTVCLALQQTSREACVLQATANAAPQVYLQGCSQLASKWGRCTCKATPDSRRQVIHAAHQAQCLTLTMRVTHRDAKRARRAPAPMPAHTRPRTAAL